MLKVKMNYQ